MTRRECASIATEPVGRERPVTQKRFDPKRSVLLKTAGVGLRAALVSGPQALNAVSWSGRLSQTASGSRKTGPKKVAPVDPLLVSLRLASADSQKKWLAGLARCDIAQDLQGGCSCAQLLLSRWWCVSHAP